MGPKFGTWVFGHTHFAFDERIDGTRVVSGLAMIRQQNRVADGFQIGEKWETRWDGETLHVTSRVKKQPFWKRLLA